MPNVTIQFANCVGQKADSVRFVIPNESSEEVLMTRSQPDSVMSVKHVGNASMI